MVALCVGLALLQGCHRQTAYFTEPQFSHEVSPQPPRVGQTTISVRVTDLSGKPVSGLPVEFEANMSHAGMPPVFAKATEVEKGNYRATLELSMAGDWIVVAHATLIDGRKASYKFEINGVASQ